MSLRTLLMVVLWTCALRAQATKAELFGVIHDPAGLPVIGATVKLVNVGTDVKSSVRTDAKGAYHFFALPSGTYRMEVAKEGFSTLRREGLFLRVGDRLSIDLELKIGDVSQSVEVTAAAPLLQSSRGTASFVVEQKKVVTLPLDGRNFIPLIALSPGVMLPPAFRCRGSTAAGRVSASTSMTASACSSRNPARWPTIPVVDAIEEFRVETNSYSAEYGRSNGGVIMVNHKSGSNDFHGTLFEFFRNEALNARNLFATTGPKPRFRRNQYGFVARRTRFSATRPSSSPTGRARGSTPASSAPALFPRPAQNAESSRSRSSIPRRPARPSRVYVRDPFPDNTIPADRYDPAARAVLDRYPAPNVFSGRTKRPRITTGASGMTPQRRISSTCAWIDYFGAGTGSSAAMPTFGMTLHPLRRCRTAAAFHRRLHRRHVDPRRQHRRRAQLEPVAHERQPAPVRFTRRGFDRASLRPVSRQQRYRGFQILLTSFSDVLPTYDIVGLQQLGPQLTATPTSPLPSLSSSTTSPGSAAVTA